MQLKSCLFGWTSFCICLYCNQVPYLWLIKRIFTEKVFRCVAFSMNTKAFHLFHSYNSWGHCLDPTGVPFPNIVHGHQKVHLAAIQCCQVFLIQVISLSERRSISRLNSGNFGIFDPDESNSNVNSWLKSALKIIQNDTEFA